MHRKKNIAASLRKLLWFQKTADPVRDKHQLIHQTLALGDLEDWRHLFKLYSLAEIKKEFLKPASGLYDPAVLRLAQTMLGIKKLPVRFYVKALLKNNSPISLPSSPHLQLFLNRENPHRNTATPRTPLNRKS